jgi:hypothetical protein
MCLVLPLGAMAVREKATASSAPRVHVSRPYPGPTVLPA